jgi:low temperature requirement protein LtrA
MWWMYFASDDDRAVEAMDAAPPERRPVWAILGYFGAHLLMIFGILLLAAGTRLAVGDLLAATSSAGAWLVACGAGLYAAGSASFRLSLHFADPVPRAVGAIACLGSVPVGRYGSVAAELGVVAAVLGATLLLEHLLESRPDVNAASPSEKMSA